jgi:hypothetical protein
MMDAHALTAKDNDALARVGSLSFRARGEI